MPVKEEIIKVLSKNLAPIYLNVEDFSESHRGHAGFREGFQTHLAVSIVSDAFIKKTQIERQRLIYGLLGHLFTNGPLHALTLKTLTGDEAKNRKLL